MHRRAGRIRCRDSQLLPKLADKALFRVLPLLNMTARQVPHIGIPTASGASMTQQHPIAVAKNGRHNPDRTGIVSGHRHRHILTHADLPRSAASPFRWRLRPRGTAQRPHDAMWAPTGHDGCRLRLAELAGGPYPPESYRRIEETQEHRGDVLFLLGRPAARRASQELASTVVVGV
jgi:hypothetical protein